MFPRKLVGYKVLYKAKRLFAVRYGKMEIMHMCVACNMLGIIMVWVLCNIVNEVNLMDALAYGYIK